MKTFSATPADIEKKWIIIDAEGVVLGRLASIIAMRLRGKHKATFTPHMDMGDNVIVINADKGPDDRQKARRTFLLAHRLSGWDQERAPRQQILEGAHPGARCDPGGQAHAAGQPAVAVKQMTNLRVYAGAEHPHEAQSHLKFWT